MKKNETLELRIEEKVTSSMYKVHEVDDLLGKSYDSLENLEEGELKNYWNSLEFSTKISKILFIVAKIIMAIELKGELDKIPEDRWPDFISEKFSERFPNYKK